MDIEDNNNIYEDIEKSPFIDDDGYYIYGNDLWNNCLKNLDVHYPLLNQKYSEYICNIEWTFPDDEDNDGDIYIFDFSFVITKNEQRYLKISTKLKNNMNSEIDDLTEAFRYIISNGINDIKILGTNKNFLTITYPSEFIYSSKICVQEEYTINTIEYFYPMNRNNVDKDLIFCMKKLVEHILSIEH